MTILTKSEKLKNYHMSRAKKHLNTKHGRLTIIELAGVELVGKSPKSAKRRSLVKCLCDCGKEKILPLLHVLRGNASSCGCLRAETNISNALNGVQTKIKKGYVEKDPKIGSAKKVWKFYSDENLSFDDFLILSQQNCFYCGAPPANCRNAYVGKKYTSFRKDNGNFTYSGLDRVDSSLGHFKNNVVPCCINCNVAKLDRSQEDFFNWIKSVYDRHLKL